MEESNEKLFSEQGLNLVPLSVIGRGTFSRVILARSTDAKYVDDDDDDLVAVKVMAKNRLRRRSQVERTETELRVLSEVASTSSYIVHCKQAYQTDDLLLCVLEYGGRDLRSHLRQWGRLSSIKVQSLGIQIIKGIQHLHSHGVLYRDLKPENVLISHRGQVKLADFGLSKFLSLKTGLLSCMPILGTTQREKWGTTRTACGTPVYQCPEMIRSQRYGLDADWWAFGNVIFELLTGQAPFLAATIPEVHELILKNEISFPDYVSKDARSMIVGLLHPLRSLRLGYGSAAALRLLNHPFLKSVVESRDGFEEDLKAVIDDVYCTDDSYRPEFIKSSDSPIHVRGFREVPNEAFARFVSIEGHSERSLSRLSSHSSCSLAVV